MADSEKRTRVVIDGNSKGGELAFANIGNAAKKVQGEVSNLNSTMGTLGSVIAAGGIVAAVSSALQAASQMERANVGLAVTARYAGADITAANQAAKELAKDGLMSAAEASQSLQNLLGRGYTLKESIDLMNRLKDSASFNRQAHLEFGQSIVGATEGLKNENSVLVDNAGVTKNVSVMWKEYALQHGKSVDNLTQAEKRQAEYLGIMRETEGQVGNSVRMLNTYAGSQAKFNQVIFETRAAFGTALQPALKGTLDMLLPIVRGIRDMVFWVQTLGPRAAATIDKIKIAKDIALSGKGLFSKEGQEEYKRRTQPINDLLAQEIERIVKEADGQKLPEIGADTGKRRKDIVLPKNDEKRAGIDAELQQRLAKIKRATDEEVQFYQTLDKYLELMYANREITEREYLDNKRDLQDRTTQATIDGLELEKTAIQKSNADKQGLYKEQTQAIKEQGATKAKIADIDREIEKKREEGLRRGIDLEIKTSSELRGIRNEELMQTRDFQLKLMAGDIEARNQTMSTAASIAEEKLKAIDKEREALDVHYGYLQYDLNRRMQLKLGELQQEGATEAQKQTIRQQFAMEHLALEQQKAQQLADIWWNNSQTYINFAQQMTTMGLQFLFFEEEQKGQIGRRMLGTSLRFITQGLQQYMMGKAKEHFLNAAAAAGKTQLDVAQHTASLTLLETEATAWAAFLTILASNPYGGEPVIPAATAMTAFAGMALPTLIGGLTAIGGTAVASELAMGAAWAAGGIAVGALGEAGASAIEGGTRGSTSPAGYGAGSYGSPVVTQPVQSASSQNMSINVYVDSMYGDKATLTRWAEEHLAPAVRDAVNRNVNFNLIPRK